MTIIYSWIFGFLMVLASISLLKPLALRIGLVDAPGGRKQHNGSIPLIGGVAMFIGFTFCLLTLDQSLSVYRSFIAASALLIFVGVLDDFHELTAKARFLAQIIAAILMVVWGNNQLNTFGNILFLGDINLFAWSVPITIFAVVGIINAVNMIDGVDGLAGSLALTEYIFLAILAYFNHQFADLRILGILIFILLGFLAFNFRFPGRKHAPVFMGDAGSMFIGFSLAWFLVSLSQDDSTLSRPVTMLWIMAIPLFDTTRLMVSRMLAQKSPFSSDCNHIHHILARRGWSPFAITVLLTGFSVLFALLGIVGSYYNFSDGILFCGFIASFLLYYIWVEKKYG